jgi:mono/diheme cytochrome c family protein
MARRMLPSTLRLTRQWAMGCAIALVLAAVTAASTITWAQSGPWTAPAAEKAKKNPTPGGASAIAAGKKVAQVNCVTCHGAGGKGDGAAAVALNPKPADWTSKRVQDESDGELFWKISNGRGAMPPWKHLPENDRWAVLHFIRSLKK